MQTVIWRIHDHKPGHANQTRGLVRELSSLVELEGHDIPVASRWQNLAWWLIRSFPPGNDLPRPDLIIGAGHATHMAVLAARRAHGGKAIVLMKPSLRLPSFDLCIVPEHDKVGGANVLPTRGVLNVIEPSSAKKPSQGLMLIGGPSANSAWDNDAMITQIIVAAAAQPCVQWTLTTSRRTPEEFVPLLSAECPDNLIIVPCEQTCPNWLPRELAGAAQVWVSEDSVSMVYEALTSGAAVGLLTVPGKQTGRVASGMRRLEHGGWVTSFPAWDRATPLPCPPAELHEARRCAELICERFQIPRNEHRNSRLAG